MKLLYLCELHLGFATALIVSIGCCFGQTQASGPVSSYAGGCAVVESFVRTIYADGFPVEAAMKLRGNSCAVPTLVQMLGRESDLTFSPNVVLTLGILGDEKTVGVLKNFLEQGTATPVGWAYVAKTNVPLALGYLANLSIGRGREAALNYLSRAIDPLYWREHLQWQAASEKEAGLRNLYLSSKVVQGLGVSGTQEGQKILVKVLDQLKGHGGKKVGLGWSDVYLLPGQRVEAERLVQDCLRANAIVSDKGLDAYYAQ